MIRRGLIKPYSAQFSGFAWPFVSSLSDSRSSNSSFTVLPTVVRVNEVHVNEDLEELDKSKRNVITIIILINIFTSAFGNNYQYAAMPVCCVCCIVLYKAIYDII